MKNLNQEITQIKDEVERLQGRIETATQGARDKISNTDNPKIELLGKSFIVNSKDLADKPWSVFHHDWRAQGAILLGALDAMKDSPKTSKTFFETLLDDKTWGTKTSANIGWQGQNLPFSKEFVQTIRSELEEAIVLTQLLDAGAAWAKTARKATGP